MPQELETLRNNGKFADLNRENLEEDPRSTLANVIRSQEDYVIQVSEEIEGRVTKKLCKEFNRTESQNISSPARDNLVELLAIFRRNYFKHQSRATAKQKFQKLDFVPANQKFVVFLDELQKLAVRISSSGDH